MVAAFRRIIVHATHFQYTILCKLQFSCPSEAPLHAQQTAPESGTAQKARGSWWWRAEASEPSSEGRRASFISSAWRMPSLSSRLRTAQASIVHPVAACPPARPGGNPLKYVPSSAHYLAFNRVSGCFLLEHADL